MTSLQWWKPPTASVNYVTNIQWWKVHLSAKNWGTVWRNLEHTYLEYFHFVLFYNSTTWKILCYIYLTAEVTNKTYDYCIKYNVFVKNGTLKLAPPEPVTTLEYAPLFTRLCISNDNSIISYRRDSVQFAGTIYYCSKILNVWLLYVNYYFHMIEWQSYYFFPTLQI